MVCVPWLRCVVARAALPLRKGAVPMVFDPSLKATVPEPGTLAQRVTVKITGWPIFIKAELLSAMHVPPWLSNSVSAELKESETASSCAPSPLKSSVESQ